MKNEAVALCRVSTAEQRVDGNSLESQQKHVYVFAQDILGTEIDRLWSLDVSSKTGKNITRKDLLEIRQYCKDHKYIKYFIVDKVNRLMREIKMFYWFIQELEMIGVKTCFADVSQQDLNKDDASAQLKLFLAIFGAEQDNKERAHTTLTRMKDRILAGYRLAPVLQGYKKSSIPGLHEPDELRFSLLQSAMRSIIAGRFTIYEALADLKERGYRTPCGKELRVDKFRVILVDVYYTGFISVTKWDDERFKHIKGNHKAMITEDEHKKLESIVLGKKRFSERKKDRKELFLGNLGLCECRGKLVGFVHRNGKKADLPWEKLKYRCRNCGKQYHADKVHASLDNKLKNLGFNRSEKDGFTESLTKVWSEEEQNTVQRIKEFQQRKMTLESEKSQVARKLALNNDKELEKDFTDTLRTIKDEIDRKDEEIRSLSENESDMINFIRFSLKFLDGNMYLWRGLDQNQRIKCKQLLFPGEIIVNFSGKVCTPQISPILCLIGTKKEALNASNSDVVEVRGVAPLSKRLKTHSSNKFSYL